MARPYRRAEMRTSHCSTLHRRAEGVDETVKKDRVTSNFIIAIAQALCSLNSFESAMNELCAILGCALRPSRIIIWGLSNEATLNAFEWCADERAPQFRACSPSVYEEFAFWEQMCVDGSVIEIPDVFARNRLEERNPWICSDLRLRGVERALIVPLMGESGTIGYLCVENHVPEHDVDAVRLLDTVAPFVSTRMESCRVMQELHHMSRSDGLTGLLNRHGIDLATKETLSDRTNEPYALVLIDIDDFKVINDMCGHETGDRALQSLAHTLEQTFPEGTVLGRNGGDEFLALLIGENSSQVATILGGLERRNLSIECDEKKYPLSLSIGYVESCQVADLHQAMSKADAALYAAKLAGKAVFRKYDEGMQKQPRTQLGFTSRDIVQNIPGAVLVHRPADGEILYANDELMSLMECENLNDLFAFTGGCFSNIVHPGDRERVCALLEFDEGQKDPGEKSCMEFRVVTKNGKTHHVRSVGKYAEADGIGEVRYELITG